MGKRHRHVVSVVCLVATIVAGGCLARMAAVPEDPNSGQAEGRASAVLVRAQPAERRALAMVVYGLGKSEAQPRRIASLTSAVEGRVMQLLANQGDAVKQGQVIVELDQAVAAAALAEKQAACDGAEAALRLLESLPRPEEQQATRLAIEEAGLVVAKAQANVDRLRPLRARNEIPEAQMYEAESALQQAVVQQRAAESHLSALLLNPRPEAVGQAKTQIASAEAAAASARAQLELLSIRSPIDGVLDSLTCRLGQTLSVGSPIGEVVDLRQIDVVVWLPVAKVEAVRLGQSTRFVREETGAEESNQAASAGAAEPAPEEPLTGQVTFIGRVADPQTGNLPVRIAVDNAKGGLTLGEVLGAEITVNEKQDALAVPAEAIEDLGEGPVLNVIRSGKSVVLHPRLGIRDNRWVEVLDTDLAPGEPVIVEGGYNMPEGTEVTTEAGDEAGAELHQEQQTEAGRVVEKQGAEKAQPGAKP